VAGTGIGVGAEVGVAGELFGPAGYSLKVHAQGYVDAFQGAGTRWMNGGAAEELFVTTTLTVIVRL